MLPHLAGDGGKKARSPGRSRISRKTIAQGRPDDSAEPVVLPRAFLLHADHGCQPAPGLPCALLLRGGWFVAKTRTQRAARMLTAVTLHCHAPLQAGHPVFQRPIAYARKSLEYWIARSSRATTTESVKCCGATREGMPTRFYSAALAAACGRYCAAGCGALSRARPLPNSFSRKVPSA